MPQPRYLILADDDFGPMTSKTANSVIRYCGERVVGVLDRPQAGATAESILGFGAPSPSLPPWRTGWPWAPTPC